MDLITLYEVKKKKICIKYHLGKSSRWYTPQWLIENITEYSSFDFEFFLREIFEEAYQLYCDDGHTKWKLHLLDNSLVCKEYILECFHGNSSIGRNYWEDLSNKEYIKRKITFPEQGYEDLW
ncbi:Uncharacterized protein FWK35_00019769 [Aphis craccivora]|uniref:Uncharacterized protein n=1 Tax=Aphis craccivora TaxID=307492 RepID=A0A6G0Y0T7_APHCR|nr:Uncharacterized protein FWK35_00019769 [Aphis craccivora]